MTELVKNYYDNGTLKEQYTLVNGVKEGVYQCWYQNGKKYMEYTYLSGKLEGLYQAWNVRGKKWYKSTFIAEQRHGPVYYLYDNGKKRREYTYVCGKRHGWFSSWNLDGSINQVTLFRDDEKIDFQVLAKERLNIIMEELMATIYHPDRLERMAKRYNMDAMDYLEYLN